jgi:HEAT repeat protein
MSRSTELGQTMDELFDAERAVRAAHAKLADTDPKTLLPAIEEAIKESRANDDEEERTLRLARLASLLGELEGAKVVDLLIDILGCEDPEARHVAGEALEDHAYDRFKEVALGIERALERLPVGNLALVELPYLLADIPEGGVLKLLERFLAHKDPDSVASAIEAIAELGDPAAAPLLARLEKDARHVQLEDDDGEEGKVTIGELAAEARELIEAAAPSIAAATQASSRDGKGNKGAPRK